MIDGLKAYPAYKDSGLLWLGKVPEHWEVKRGKNLFRCIDIRSSTGEEELLTVSSEHGVVPRRSAIVTMFKAESYLGYKLCWPGDLVINSLWAWARGLGVSQFHGIVSTAYGVYRPRAGGDIDSRFIHELVRSTPFHWELRVRSKGVWTSRLQLTDESFLGAPFPLPPLPEQTAIVRFLDHANRRIKRYIRAKKKLIALLNEQKRVIIDRAVTRGLDRNVRLKPSGIPWLGEIPEHWATISLGAASELIQTGPFGSQLHSHEYVEGGIPVINPSHLHEGRIIPDMSITIHQSKANELKRHKLRVGDIVAARRGELGRCGLVTATEQGWICGTGSLRICCETSLYDPAYLVRLFSSQGVRDSLSLSSIGATMDNVNAGMVARLRLPLPSLDEQYRIVPLIEAEESQSRSAVSIVEREIALMREYRTRLMADVVTGHVDVREAAAMLPDEVKELETIDEGESVDEQNGNETQADIDEVGDSVRIG